MFYCRSYLNMVSIKWVVFLIFVDNSIIFLLDILVSSPSFNQYFDSLILVLINILIA